MIGDENMVDGNIYKEVIIDGETKKEIVKLDDDEIETNDTKIFLDDTLELNELVEEIKHND